MALVIGTNAGFVLVAPTTDPQGPQETALDPYSFSMKVTSPAVITRVTEMGIYIMENPGGAPDFEMGIYTHDVGNNRPGDLIGKSAAGALSVGLGWKIKAGLSINISPNTIYWLAVQVDNDPGGYVKADRTSDPTPKRDYKDPSYTLSDPWGISDGSFTGILAIYAVYVGEAAYPVSSLRKGLLSGFHVFMDQYIKAKNESLLPLKKPDGTVF